MPIILLTPQNLQIQHLLRPIVSRRGAITYGVAKELANIIRPLIDHPNHIREMPNIFLKTSRPSNCKKGNALSPMMLRPFFFTSVPVDPAISIITKNKLQQDPQLHNRISMSSQYIITLLEFYLENMYFLLQDKYFEQVHGATMVPHQHPSSQCVHRRFQIQGPSALFSIHPGCGLCV